MSTSWDIMSTLGDTMSTSGNIMMTKNLLFSIDFIGLHRNPVQFAIFQKLLAF